MEGAIAVKKDDGKYDEWAVRSALRTLTEAAELLKDAKMMKLVEVERKKKIKSINSIDDLRKLAKEGK